MPKIVFIIGMHRSGTSALSGALRFCGYSHGARLMPAAPDNPRGFWEPLPVVRLNNRILEVAGGRWDRIPLWVDFETLAPAAFGQWCIGSFGDAASEAWDEAFGGVDGDLVCKDPRLSLTLPLWQEIARRKGYETDVLLAYRSPQEIAASLARRNGTAFSDSLELITDYWLAMLANAPQSARIVNCSRFVDAPLETLESLGFNPVSPEAADEMTAFVDRKAVQSPDRILPRPLLSRAIQIMDSVLAAADGACLLPAATRFLPTLVRAREDHKHFKGQIYMLPPGEPPEAFSVLRKRHRTVVLHCHVFKNAGSSVDAILKDNFGARWLVKEFPTRGGHTNSDLTNAFIRASDRFDAVSTHTGDWWLGHGDESLTVLPILFLRHPLLRIRSAYTFERNQDADTEGARLAKEMDLAGYVRARLAKPNDFSIQDFQSRRLACYQSRTFADLRSAALRALEAAPYIGLVEDFEGSAKRLEAYLKPHFEKFAAYETRRNVSDASSATPAEKVARMARELGEELYEALLAENAIDMEVYEAVEADWEFDREKVLSEASE